MRDLHVCQHMCRHYVAERSTPGMDTIELRGVFVMTNPCDDFVRWMMRDVTVVRITGKKFRAGGEHYDHFLTLERQADDSWYRRTVFGWEKVVDQ